MTEILPSYIGGRWHLPADQGTVLTDPATGAPVARISAESLDYRPVLDHARQVGGPALRALTFTDRAAMLKRLGKHLSEKIPDFTALSLRTGCTRRDAVIDIDGGINALFVYGSKGSRALPDAHVLADGPAEPLGRGGTFAVRHVQTPRTGAAVQINAFNFPVWGMLEKLAPALLAGVPSIVKPASLTAYLTVAVVREIIDAQILPEGSLQLVCARPDGLLDALTEQDSLAVTGAHETVTALRTHPAVVAGSVRFTGEADSLNSIVLGADVTAEDPEFDLFVKAVTTEMTQKAGQKCTAIRRAFVPPAMLDYVEQAVRARLATTVVGDPAAEDTRMGPLAGAAQLAEVRAAVAELATSARIVFGDPQARPESLSATADYEAGAYISPILLRADDPEAEALHRVEAFGPVATLIPYRDEEQVIDLIGRGCGSLVASVVTGDPARAARLVTAAAPWHGRIVVFDDAAAGENTGHGAAVAQAVHGGPGRAGGGQELGGLRALDHHLQRTAVQGSPAVLAALLGEDPA